VEHDHPLAVDVTADEMPPDGDLLGEPRTRGLRCAIPIDG
jgi:hypothetical protein